ncbi:hypothetical protein L7F22_058099 [Adiantum nelumboides]|nr:hypothetical protein [Adiantum nelumboides]
MDDPYLCKREETEALLEEIVALVSSSKAVHPYARSTVRGLHQLFLHDEELSLLPSNEVNGQISTIIGLNLEGIFVSGMVEQQRLSNITEKVYALLGAYTHTKDIDVLDAFLYEAFNIDPCFNAHVDLLSSFCATSALGLSSKVMEEDQIPPQKVMLFLDAMQTLSKETGSSWAPKCDELKVFMFDRLDSYDKGEQEWIIGPNFETLFLKVPSNALYTAPQEKKLLLKQAQPPTFKGEGAHAECDVEAWIEAMEDYFEAGETQPINQTMLAMFCLVGDAKIWWKQHRKDLGVLGSSQSWEKIKEAVTTRYLPSAHRDAKMNGFFALKQLSLSVGEYYSKFVTLGRYVPKMSTEQLVARFCQGLNQLCNGISL